MQMLDIYRPGMTDLEFTLLVSALCTSPLTVLNIPGTLRTIIFDRCWVLIHESPPPQRWEERVLDLRPWTGVTLDAMVETIRSILTDAGIRILTWDQTTRDATQLSKPEAQPLIDRLDHVSPQRVTLRHAVAGEAATGSDIRQLIGQLAVLMSALSPALMRGAANLATGEHNDELVIKLVKGAHVMKESGHVYLSWARHFAALSEGLAETGEADDSGFDW